MRLFFCFFLAICSSCGPKVDPVPTDILPSSKFASVMADIQLVEAAKTQNPYRRDWSEVTIQESYNEIFEKHGTSDSIFRKSFAYYQTRLDLLMPIYEEVLDSLNARDAALKKNMAAAYQESDTTNNARLQKADSLKAQLK